MEARRLRIATYGMYLAGFMAVVNISVIYLALPAIEKALHAGLADQQWILSIYPLMEGGFTLALGTLGDLYGRKRLMTYATWLFAIATLACAFAPTAPMLIGLRALQGLGGAALLSLPVAIIVQMLPNPEDNEDAIKAFSMVAGLGAVAGPVIGGALVHLFAWPAVFVLSVVMSAAVLLTLPSVPESPRDPALRLDVPGQVLSVLAFIAVSFALIEGNSDGWTSPIILGAFAAAIVLGTAFVLVERRAKQPMVHLRYFASMRFDASMLTVGIINFGWYGVMLLATLFLQSVQGQSPLIAGLYMMPSNVAFFLSNQYSAVVDRHFGSATTITAGMLISVAGLGLLVTLGAGSPSWHVAAGLFVAGIGWGFVFTPATSIGMKVVGTADEGFASGMISLSRSLFGVFGIAVLGSILGGIMSANIARGLLAQGVSRGVVAQVAAAVNHGGAFAAAAAPPAGVPKPLLHSLVQSSFTSGLHLAIAACLVLTLACTFAVYAMLRVRREAATAAV